MIYQLKITLKRSKPPIWRRIQVNPGITFQQLHQIIQISMGWLDCHLHEFECGIPIAKREQMEGLLEENKLVEELSPWYFFLSNPYYENTAIMGDPVQPDVFFQRDVFLDEHGERLADWLLGEKDKCLYTYDFKNDWQHEILLEKIVPNDPEVNYPLCVKAKRDAPMEGSGGIHNYVEDKEDSRTDQEIGQDINKTFQAMAKSLQPTAS